MNAIALGFGAGFGGLAVIFGAFGAHALKKRFSPELQQSFETGVRYQMYHSLVLLVLGLSLELDSNIEKGIIFLFILGIVLFSFSIYGLCLSSARGRKLKMLGPVTPLGGLLLTAGWVCLLVLFL